MADLSHPTRNHLLLLPPAAVSAINLTYEKSILEVLEILVENRRFKHETTVLEIAVACPFLLNANHQSRQSLYVETQALVAGVYKLVVSVATRLELDIEDADGEDIRVLLVAWAPDMQASAHVKSFGPVVSLETLAASGRPWVIAYGDESEAGVQFFKAFHEARNYVQSECAGCGHHGKTGSLHQASDDTANQSKLNKVAVGGTFDHLHVGHKLLLTMTAFAIDAARTSDGAPTLIVGISSADLLKNKQHAEYLQSWTDRAYSVLDFLRAMIEFDQDSAAALPARPDRATSVLNTIQSMVHQFSCGLRVCCIEITDPCGPTITDPAINGLVLSVETRAGGRTINAKRVEQGWSPLHILEVDVLDTTDGTEPSSTDFAAKLSSTAIRARLAAAKTAVS